MFQVGAMLPLHFESTQVFFFLFLAPHEWRGAALFLCPTQLVQEMGLATKEELEGDTPRITNLSEDPTMVGQLVFAFPEGKTVVLGRYEEESEEVRLILFPRREACDVRFLLWSYAVS